MEQDKRNSKKPYLESLKINDMKAIKNSTSRLWTNAELSKTIKDCVKMGFIVSKESETIEITNTDNNDVILRALKNDHNTYIVRIDGSYFGDCNFIEPAFIYIDNNNLVCYLNNVDNDANRSIDSLRRFVVEKSNLQLFFNYYQLKFHPYTKR